jgi:hypothetical protein
MIRLEHSLNGSKLSSRVFWCGGTLLVIESANKEVGNKSFAASKNDILMMPRLLAIGGDR